MMERALRFLVILALPLGGLGWLWASSDAASRRGTDWEVAIQGYDPRDLLRGHYVEFRYDWPIAGDGENEPVLALCLDGTPPAIREARVIDPGDEAALEACAHRLVADPGDVYGFRGLERGRLYVGQDRARAIEEDLADREQRGIVTFRQREDGALTPIGIRFRPLTPAERAQTGE
jgi:hypothetical protein